MLFETHVEANKVELFFEGDNSPCMLRIQHVPSGVVIVDDTFANACLLSAQLRDTLGYSPALKLLDYWGISPNSDLYDLNHQRPYPILPQMARDIDDMFDDKSNLPSGDWVQIAETGWSNYEEGASYALLENTKTRKLGMLYVTQTLFGRDEAFEEHYTYTGWVNLVKGCED